MHSFESIRYRTVPVCRYEGVAKRHELRCASIAKMFIATLFVTRIPQEPIQLFFDPTDPLCGTRTVGKYRRTRLFALTLGHSRKSVQLLVFHSSGRAWAELHEKAFRRLGGVTRVVVLDNLREGVIQGWLAS
jgi:hypothetical protein